MVQLLGTLHEFKSAAIPLVTFWRFFLLTCVIIVKLVKYKFNQLHWSTKKTFKKLQEVLQLIWTHGGSLITESSVNFHSYVQIFLNFDFLIFAFSPFFGPIFGPIFLLFLQKTSQISSSSRFGGFWGCWFHFWTKKSNYRSSWPIKVAQGHVTEVKSWKKGQGSSFSHKSITDVSKMSF